MIPNYNTGLLQQQQQQQHLHQNPPQGQQQPQKPQQQPVVQALQQQQDQHLNPSTMEQARLQWAHMQQFRQQNPSADVNHQKAAHLAELMKRTQPQPSNTFVRQQQQQAFPMGLGMPQQNNGAPVIAVNPPQQQTFHDQHPQQAHLSQGFPNMGVMPASMPARNPSAVLQNPQAARQLEMMNMTQAQQSQNALTNFPQPQQQSQQLPPPQPQQLNQMRDQQQQTQPQQQQSQFPQGLSQPDMFTSPALPADSIRRPSPHPINNPGLQQNPGVVGQGPQPLQGVPGSRSVMMASEVQNRLNSLRSSIASLSSMYDNLSQQLNNVRGNREAEAQLGQKMRDTQMEIGKRKEYMHRLAMIWNQQQQQGRANGAQPPNPWAQHPNPGQSFDPSNGQTPRQQIGLLPNQPSHPLQTSPNLPHVQAQNPLLNSGLVNARTGPTAPQQPQAPPQSLPHHAGVASPFANGMGGTNTSFPKPNMTPQQMSQPQLPQQPQQPQNGAGGGLLQQVIPGVQGGNPLAGPSAPTLALDKANFERALMAFSTKRGVKIDPRVIGMENRPLDLHALHIQVMQEGGFAKIEGNDNLWSIIGGRLGFVQFPGTPTEPAKSGPGVAQSLQHVYKEFIAPFELWYFNHVQDLKKQQQFLLMQNQLNAIGSPYSFQQIVQMSVRSVAELRGQGIDDKVIQFVENGRPVLQRMLQEQRMFADGVRNNASQNIGHGMDQNGGLGSRQLSMGPNPPFGGPQAAQQQNALALANRQHQIALQQQHQQQLLHQQPRQQAGQHLQPQVPEGVDTMLGGPRMQQQQQPGPMQTQPQMAGTVMQSVAQKANLTRATVLIEQMKNEYLMSSATNANLDVPIEQQVEYSQFLDQLYPKSFDLDRKLPLLALIVKDENIVRRAVNITCVITQQKANMSSATGPRYIVNLEALRVMANELNRISEMFTYHALKMQQQQHQLQKQQQLQLQPQMNTMMAPPVINKPDPPQTQIRPVMPQNRPPSVVPPSQPQPTPQQQQVQPNLNQNLRPPPPVSVQPATKRKGPQTPSSAAVSSPSPSHVASAPTPVANTPTPTATASSPPAATKSPKAKALPKKTSAIPKTRRTSKVVLPVPTPVQEPAQSSAASTPTASTGKRPREEETSPSSSGNANPAEPMETTNEGSPPKRVKTEWEAQPTEAQRKKQENMANPPKTDEEVTALMDQMTELIKFAAGAEEEGQSVSLTTGISETLDMLLKGYGPHDSIDGYGSTSIAGEPSSSRESETVLGPLADAFDEFIDFSHLTAEDEDSKTPDLISSSSTNPSPESNHDVEAGHHLLASFSSTLDIKSEDTSELTRLGLWKELDGGESSFYQSADWRYESSMTSLEQPWAMFNS